MSNAANHNSANLTVIHDAFDAQLPDQATGLLERHVAIGVTMISSTGYEATNKIPFGIKGFSE